jgi:hypothetical protein
VRISMGAGGSPATAGISSNSKPRPDFQTTRTNARRSASSLGATAMARSAAGDPLKAIRTGPACDSSMGCWLPAVCSALPASGSPVAAISPEVDRARPGTRRHACSAAVDPPDGLPAGAPSQAPGGARIPGSSSPADSVSPASKADGLLHRAPGWLGDACTLTASVRPLCSAVRG